MSLPFDSPAWSRNYGEQEVVDDRVGEPKVRSESSGWADLEVILEDGGKVEPQSQLWVAVGLYATAFVRAANALQILSATPVGEVKFVSEKGGELRGFFDSDCSVSLFTHTLIPFVLLQMRIALLSPSSGWNHLLVPSAT